MEDIPYSIGIKLTIIWFLNFIGYNQYYSSEKYAYNIMSRVPHHFKLQRDGEIADDDGEYPDGTGVKIAIIDRYVRLDSKKYHKTFAGE